MLRRGDRVLVAVSGGPDSVALLHFLLSYPKIKVMAAHFNHMIRKAGAVRDEEFVKLLCKKWKVPFIAGKGDVPVHAKKNKMTVEEAARVLRYKFLENTAKKIKANKIAAGHNADDNIETFIIRLIRGTGLKGLRSIPPVNGKVVRPLLEVSRKEVLAYCRKNRLKYVIDASNNDVKYTRNRIRKELLPALSKTGKNIGPRVLRLIKAAALQYKKVEEEAARGLKSCMISASGGRLVIGTDKFHRLPGTLKSHVLRAAIEKVKGDLKDIYKVHVEDILSLKKGELHLPGGIFIFKDGKIMSVSGQKPRKGGLKVFKYQLPVPGKAVIKGTGQIVSALAIKRAPAFKNIGKQEAYIDAGRVKGKMLTVRSPKKGDRFVPLGMKGSKKLSDLFVDEKVPSGDRAGVPVVCDREKIVWVAGFRVDERVKMNEKSSRIIRLSLA